MNGLFLVQEPDIILYWCWDSTTSSSTDRKASGFTTESTGGIRNQDVASFRGDNAPVLAEPGNPKGWGKGKPPVEDTPKGSGKAGGKKGGKAKKQGKGDGTKGKGAEDTTPAADNKKVPKAKTPEQESRAVTWQRY